VKFGKVWPDRFFDVAICEQHAVTMAAGMAKAGLKPVVSIYSTFLQRAMDQVIHDVAIMKMPVIFGIDRGGLVEDGETHQGVFDITMLRAVPNFTVIAPANARELRNMVYSALKLNNGPVAIRFPREKAVQAEQIDGFEFIDYTRWEVLNPGAIGLSSNAEKGPSACSTANSSGAKDKSVSKVVLLAYGAMVETARQALPELLKAGIDATLVNARSAKPLDAEW
jgi:1-deoxy-D-xylulose-5-phosphate synthase